MSFEFDLACLRAPCDPGDPIGVFQLATRAKMAADDIESLVSALKDVVTFIGPKTKYKTGCNCSDCACIRNAVEVLARVQA